MADNERSNPFDTLIGVYKNGLLSHLVAWTADQSKLVALSLE
jgi:hypothetical protein